MKMRKMYCLSFLIALAILASTTTKAQPQIELVQVQAVKDSEGAMIPKFDFELRISGLPEMYIKAMEGKPFSVVDDKGADLLAEGKRILDAKMAPGGFYTSTAIGWEFFDLRFYDNENAFRAHFTTYSPPSPGANFVNVKGSFKVMIRKPGKTTEIKLKKVDPSKGDTIRTQGKEIVFVDNGSMTTGDDKFLVYTFNPELAVVEASIPGFKMPAEVSKNAHEIYVREGTKSFDLVLKVADTEFIEIPISHKVTLGM